MTKDGKQPAIHRYVALCCPDFPLYRNRAIARLIDSTKLLNYMKSESEGGALR